MNADTRRHILDELLRNGSPHLGHAYHILDELQAELDRYQESAAMQAEARRAIGREKRGRPRDVAERDFEGRVLEVLRVYGVPLSDTSSGVAATVLDLMRGTAGEPRNALRRGKRRLSGLDRLAAAFQRLAARR